MPKFDLSSLIGELTTTLRQELVTLIDTAQEDVDSVVTEIAPLLVSAAAAGDTAMTDELKSQLWAVVEINKIRAAKSAWRTIRSVSAVALKALSAGLALASGNVAGAVQAVAGEVES